MDKYNLLGELDDKELDSLFAYSVPYTEENHINIKTKFEKNSLKLKEKKIHTRKRTKFTVAIVAAALLCLTTITAFAASQGAFYGLFRNLGDVAGYVQTPNQQVTSNGITMALSSYLADDSGIAMDLTFTRNDGSTFAADTVAIGSEEPLFWPTPYEVRVLRGSPEVRINGDTQWIGPQSIVSNDGQTYRSFIVAHCDITDDTPLELSVSRLIYNISARFETVQLDLYELYQNTHVAEITLHNKDYDMQVLRDLFDNAPATPFMTESGIRIHSVVFVRATLQSNTDFDLSELSDFTDGVDIAGLLPYNYIVGIQYTSRIETDNTEYHFNPTSLHNNADPFGWSENNSQTNTGYQFFRVSCIDELVNYGVSSFEHLQNIGGIDFTVVTNNFIAGPWHIETEVSANRESSHIVLDKAVDTGNPDIVPFLCYADISLFTTTITFEVHDANGNIRSNIPWYDMNDYVFNFIHSDVFSLRYKNGEEIPLQFMQYAMCCCGINVFKSFMPTSHEYFVLMNTSQLEAIIIDGLEFLVE